MLAAIGVGSGRRALRRRSRRRARRRRSRSARRTERAGGASASCANSPRGTAAGDWSVLPRRRRLRATTSRRPSTVLARRSEFYTAYTPYQPEVEPGHAAGGVRVPVADLRAARHGRRQRRRCTTAPRRPPRRADGAAPHRREEGRSSPRASHRTYRRTLDDLRGGALGVEIVRRRRPRRSTPSAAGRRRARACVVVQQPDFFGTSRSRGHRRRGARSGALLVVVAPSRIALGLLESPGALGADIAVGEGQRSASARLRRAVRRPVRVHAEVLVRQMPGRLVGADVDADGQARLRADAADARAAHPPREGDVEHLHEPGADGARAHRLPVAARAGGSARAARAGVRQRAHALANRLAALPTAGRVRRAVLQRVHAAHRDAADGDSRRALADRHPSRGVAATATASPRARRRASSQCTETHERADIDALVDGVAGLALARRAATMTVEAAADARSRRDQLLQHSSRCSSSGAPGRAARRCRARRAADDPAAAPARRAARRLPGAARGSRGRGRAALHAPVAAELLRSTAGSTRSARAR